MRDVYQEVTNKIVAELERGVAPWHKPWAAGSADGGAIPCRPVRSCGTPYNGINVLLLWSEQIDRGYSGNQWMTFKQAIGLGGCVRKGEKGAMVVYADRSVKTRRNDATGEEETFAVPFMKAYTVFNVSQVDGLPERFNRPTVVVPVSEPARNARVDDFVLASGAEIKHGGNRAFCARQGAGFIQMPFLAQFETAEAYYATLLHELTHWSGHEPRLNRVYGKRFGDEAYAAEELVAELGAAFLCADLSVTAETRADHASYIASWLKVLRNDKRAIFTAASMAQRAADYLAALGGSAEQLAIAA